MAILKEGSKIDNKEIATKEDIEKELGTIKNLKTNNKNNLVNAINEVFTSANNSLQKLDNNRQNLINAVVGVDKNLNIDSNASFEDIIKNISKISTGKKWARGQLSQSKKGTCVVNNLNFTPSTVLILENFKNGIEEECVVHFFTSMLKNTTNYYFNNNISLELFCNGENMSKGWTHSSIKMLNNSFTVDINTKEENTINWIAIE